MNSDGSGGGGSGGGEGDFLAGGMCGGKNSIRPPIFEGVGVAIGCLEDARATPMIRGAQGRKMV